MQKALVSLMALGVAATLQGQRAVPSIPTYGTSAVTYVQVPAEAFLPRFSFDYSNGSGATRYAIGCGGMCFAAPLYLPGGAAIVSLELDFDDLAANGFVAGALVVCGSTGQNCSFYPSAGGGPADCTTPGSICSGLAFDTGPGSTAVIMSGDGVTVDNATKSYRLHAGGSGTATTAIAGMIVGYVLQVSPEPATATFNDVPTSHPFFQFVEALSKSGITAGCGGGNFCPDQPITRGQMAVFLAKALGLQWP